MTICMTELAALHVSQAMKNNNSREHYVRVGIRSGGCSGYTYVLDVVDETSTSDRMFKQHGIKIICDPKSYLYLNGMEIDYIDSMMGGGFKFNNPSASRSCGCGTSFSP